RQLPGVECCLHDEVCRSDDHPALVRLHVCLAPLGPPHHVRLPLGLGSGARGDPQPNRARTSRLDGNARGREQLGGAAEVDTVRGALPSERPDQTQVAGFHRSSVNRLARACQPLTAPRVSPRTRKRWRATVMTIFGSITMTAAALISPYSGPMSVVNPA